ncbi:Phosphoinositide phosphatase [Nymphaea thermarum]|nr:Phosphoinositide phosphatase [Nymphaea thermarum]
MICRYLKRGVNDRGRVANDVETEQIVLDEEAGSFKGKMSSVVQMRGSIPLFWSQETSRFSPKPDIILQRYDPTYQATKLHFEDLACRYGNPIIVLNLIKTVEKRPREMMLRREFASAVGYLNQILPEDKHLKFIHWDFHKFAKSKSANVLAVLGAVASEALDLTGFYYSGKRTVPKKRMNQLSRTSTSSLEISSFSYSFFFVNFRTSSVELAKIGGVTEYLNSMINRDRENEADQQQKSTKDTGSEPRFQNGVLRTNCIDCLDRTNVAQYAYGLAALGRQLHAVGLSDVPKVDPDSSIAEALTDMYQSMGDALALQYGGSAAHNTVYRDFYEHKQELISCMNQVLTERQGKWKATTQSREFLKSIKRYYSNTYTDGEKQDAMNLYSSFWVVHVFYIVFLGYFQPQEGKPALWELDSDYYLHVSGMCEESAQYNSLSPDAMSIIGAGTNLYPVPACREDFSRMKLTSFDKLIERTCSSIKNVRLSREPDVKVASSISGMAPDAAEIQLKSPNWLFGQRKYGDNSSVSKFSSQDSTAMKSQEEMNADNFCELSWLFFGDVCEEDIFQRYLAMTSGGNSNSLYDGNLLFDQDESSEIYMHYAELCQGPALEPFKHEPEKEKHYAEVLQLPIMEGADDTNVALEMEAALREYEHIGSDLGITATCKFSAADPSRLTRWIIGEEGRKV